MSLLQFYHDQHVQLPIVTTEASCNGKTFIVTGANTGLGFEAAKHFVKCRSTRVILAVRSLERGGEAKTRIEADTGVTGVAEVWQLDLSSYSSIKAFTSRVDALDRLDATIENAGIGTSIFTLSEEYETSITINVVGTFLLASLILPKLQSTAVKTGAKTHLAVVGSGAGFYAAKQLEKLPANVDILKYLSTKDKDMTNRYVVIKLIQLYILRELAALKSVSNGVIISYINPGLCRTGLSRDSGWMFKLQLRILWAIMGRTAEEGSRTLIHGAFVNEGCHGSFMSECQERDSYVPGWVTNESGQKLQQRLWTELRTILNGVSPGCI